MEKNLKAFMKAELKERKNETVEYPGIKTFVDENGEPIPFIIRRLTVGEIREIRDLYREKKIFRDKKSGRPVIENGEVAVIREYDAERAGRHIMVKAFVQPKMDDPELMEFYGVNDKLDMPEVLFADSDDFRYANSCVLEACGLKEKQSETETVEEIKK